MTNRYVRSTDGSDADNGSTWALAKATLAGTAAIDAAGDTIYVSQAHSESTAGVVTLNFAGTVASPVRVLCGNDGAEPPSALATSAIIANAANNNINWNSAGGCTYGYGLTLKSGVGQSGTANINGIGEHQIFENCTFELASTGAASVISLSQGLGYTLTRNCGFKFANAGQYIACVEPILHIQGGSILAGSTSPTLLVGPSQRSEFLIEGFDASVASAGMHICSSTVAGVKGVLRNCKLPASWSGSLNSLTPGDGSVYELFNCDGGDTHYRYRKATQFGTIQDETTIVRTGGASDGVTTWSLKMVSNANAEYPMYTLDCPERVQWNDTVGSAITATVEFVHDSLTNLKDNEVWLEVEYLGTSGFPISTHISDAVANVLTTAADQADSTETWTTTGLTNPNTQKLSVTFTPQEAGYIHYTVKLAKASTIVYADPKLTIS